MVRYLDDTTLRLFGSYPREVANPQRQIVYNALEVDDFVSVNNGINDCYISLFSLSLDIDKIFFDLDGEKSFSDAKKLVKYGLDNEIPVIPVTSGKKGIHIYYMFKPEIYPDIDDSKRLFTSVSLGIIEKVFENNENSVDKHVVGDARRITRLPNTLRPPENINWCTFLPPAEQFLKMDEVDFWMQSKIPHHYDYDLSPKKTLRDLPASKKYKGEIASQDWEPLPDPVHHKFSSNFWKNKKIDLLGKILRPCLFRKITTTHPSHAVRVATTIDLLQNFDTDEILELYSKLHWEDFDRNITRYQITTCQSLKPYSCSKLKRLKITMKCCE